tara:strand:- start:548 stop:958 length:411 start_codon:yes stop_codon:yes gene_type:complete
VKKRKKILYVYYGLTKIYRNKRKRRPELVVIYENSESNERKKNWIDRRWKVVYKRKQTKIETKMAQYETREFYTYNYIVSDPKWEDDVDRVLFAIAKIGALLSKKEREKINKILREEYFKFYNIKDKIKQLNLFKY